MHSDGCGNSPRGRDPAFFSHRSEETMSRVISFDKGSKRRIKQIRWNQVEVTSAVLLSLVLMVLCLFFAIWEPFDDPVESQTHQVRQRR
jgi:hypothetical protein